MMICLCSKLVLSAVYTFMFTALKRKLHILSFNGIASPLLPFPNRKKKSKLFRLIVSGCGELCHIINIYKYMYKYTFLSMREDKRILHYRVPNIDHYTMEYAQFNKDVVKFNTLF